MFWQIRFIFITKRVWISSEIRTLQMSLKFVSYSINTDELVPDGNSESSLYISKKCIAQQVILTDQYKAVNFRFITTTLTSIYTVVRVVDVVKLSKLLKVFF